MKTRGMARCFLAATIVYTLSVVLQVSLLVQVNADEAGSSCEIDPETGVCNSNSKYWVDEFGDKTKQFLEEKVFGQEKATNSGSGFLTRVAGGIQPRNGNKKDEPINPFFKLLDKLADSGIGVDEKVMDKSSTMKNEMISALLQRSTLMNQEEQAIVGLDFLSLMQESLKKAMAQLKSTFGDVMADVDPSIPIAMIYFLAQEDARKNPSWKRRQHRFYDKVSKPIVIELHDALYLSQLAYVSTVEDFKKGLTNFRNNAWEMAFGTTESLPHLPAHFLLIHKNLAPLPDPAESSVLPWEGKKESELQVTLVVRGTKHLADALADALLEPVEYRGGHAHSGILSSGKNLAEKYAPKLKELLKYSGRDKIRLYIVGHSLGAASASIAAMEFKDHDFITVEAVGFGCPSLLSKELSESTKDYITTVVADADVIPRMSGASMVNMMLNLMEYDWSDSAIEDIEYSLEKAREVLPFGHLLPSKDTVLQWSQDFMNKEIRPKYGKDKRDRIPSVLIPPGNCIHFFRDGVGFSGAYTPCSFFSEIDLARTLIDDHLVMPGYHRALINIIRDWDGNYNFDFSHDIASIPV